MNYIDLIPPNQKKTINLNAPSLNRANKMKNDEDAGKYFLGLTHGDTKGLPILANPAYLVNKSGTYGVMPCVPTPFSVKTLRPEPIPIEFTYGLAQGYANFQPKGLAYQEKHPLNLPPLFTPNSFNSALKSSIPNPF